MAINENQTRTSQIPDTKKDGVKPVVAAIDVIDLILRDHIPLKALLESLKDADMKRSVKEPLLEQFIPALKGHAMSEEATLYVQMKLVKDLRVDGFEGDTEHAIADQLVQEINSCPDDSEWTAKVKVLAELVENHIKEEESEMLVKAKNSIDLPMRKLLGQEYTRLKTEFDALNVIPAQAKNGAGVKFN